MLQALLVDAGDLFLLAARVHLGGKFFGKQGAQLPAHRILARHPEKLLHARVPGFHDAFEIHREDADVERLHDVFAEILEPGNLQRFLFERGIELRIVERYRDIAGDGFNEFDVVARQEVAVHRLAKAQHGDSVLVNAARNEIVEVQLLQRVADRIAYVSGSARRLEEKRSAGELYASRLAQKTQIERLRKPHTHGTRQTHLAGLRRIFHEDRQTVDQQSLRDAVHHRTEHRFDANFVGQRAAKFDECTAVVQAVAVEKTVEARLNPFAERLKEKGSYDDGDHAAHGPGSLRVEDVRDQRDQRKVHRRYGSRRCCVSQAALEDDVHIHQAVANHRVAEAQRNEHQSHNGQRHPGPLRRIEEERQHVEQSKRQTANQRAAGQPLQLLAQHTGRSLTITLIKNYSRSDEAKAEETELPFF